MDLSLLFNTLDTIIMVRMTIISSLQYNFNVNPRIKYLHFSEICVHNNCKNVAKESGQYCNDSFLGILELFKVYK